MLGKPPVRAPIPAHCNLLGQRGQAGRRTISFRGCGALSISRTFWGRRRPVPRKWAHSVRRFLGLGRKRQLATRLGIPHQGMDNFHVFGVHWSKWVHHMSPKGLLPILLAVLVSGCMQTIAKPPEKSVAEMTPAEKCMAGFDLLGRQSLSAFQKQALYDSLKAQGCYGGQTQLPKP